MHSDPDATLATDATAPCIGDRCGGSADLRCPVCRASLCYACAREHGDPSAALCSAASQPSLSTTRSSAVLRSGEVPAPCGRDLLCIEDEGTPDGIRHEAQCPRYPARASSSSSAISRSAPASIRRGGH